MEVPGLGQVPTAEAPEAAGGGGADARQHVRQRAAHAPLLLGLRGTGPAQRGARRPAAAGAG